MRPSRRPLALVGAVVGVGVLLLTRRLTSTWGTIDGEYEELLPGDILLPDAMVATRGITIDATPSAVWPWVVQIGQGRGGFYSYDVLENLVGLDIHSADRVEQRWQDVRVGDPIRLAEGFALEAADVEPGSHLVLAGVPGPRPGSRPTGPGRREPVFTWAFVLVRTPDGRTRLLVRERYARRPWPARVVAEVIQPLSFVMSAKMLRGIRDRVEHAAGAR